MTTHSPCASPSSPARPALTIVHRAVCPLATAVPTDFPHEIASWRLGFVLSLDDSCPGNERGHGRGSVTADRRRRTSVQIPKSKLQRSTKRQAQSPAWAPLVPASFLDLVFEILEPSLELGVCCLVFRLDTCCHGSVRWHLCPVVHLLECAAKPLEE